MSESSLPILPGLTASRCPSDTAICEPVRGAARKNRWDRVRIAGVVLVALGVARVCGGQVPAAKPSVEAVIRAVEAWFAAQPGYEPGDLITRSQITTVLGKLKLARVEVPNGAAIIERGLAKDSFLVRELTKPAGRQFMRKVGRTPGGFAHLDRLSTIPRGEQLIRDLSQDKGGDKLVEYLATTRGGSKLGGMMAGVPGGQNLNAPTNRIYTVEELAKAIRDAMLSGP